MEDYSLKQQLLSDAHKVIKGVKLMIDNTGLDYDQLPVEIRVLIVLGLDHDNHELHYQLHELAQFVMSGLSDTSFDTWSAGSDFLQSYLMYLKDYSNS